MYTRYYDNYPAGGYSADNGETIVPDSTYTAGESLTTETRPLPSVQSTAEVSGHISHNEEVQPHSDASARIERIGGGSEHGLLSSFQADDILLIALLFLLVTESPDDMIMPIIIGYLLLGDVLPI